VKRIIQSPRFQLFSLLLTFLSGAIWYFLPQAGAWPLLIALLPWVARIVAGRLPFQRTVFDLPLALFLLTASIGVWTAYQPEVAWAKFWIIIAAVLLYYAVSNLSMGNAWFLTGVLGLIGVSIGSYFMLTHDWHAQPADLTSLNELAQKWILVRPKLDLVAISQNRAGGILAMCLPFPIALGGQALRAKKRLLALGAFGASLLIFVFLVMTSSRGAWLASIGGFGLWFLWEASVRIARSFHKSSPGVIFLVLLAGIGIGVLIFILQINGGVYALLQRIPGRSTSASRISLYLDTLHLINDFSILGGGLGSFPGLYSQYIRLLPYFYFGYSHNFYLDVTLEQGIFGFFSLAIIFLGSVWLVVNHLRNSRASGDSYLLNWAVLVSLIIVLLHGLVDDPLYGERGTPLLFLLSGFAVASTQLSRVSDVSHRTLLYDRVFQGSLILKRRTIFLGLTLTVLLLVLFTGLMKPALAELYANLGAIEMARAELSSWPTRKWTEDTDVSSLQAARRWFDRSLELDPNNETSHYRLGLISMRAQDFHISESHLKSVQASDLDHPGLRKSLGYAYLWSGQLASGAQLLKEVPEAEHELLVYIGWWKKHGNLDLSKRAISATLLLRMIHLVDQENNKK
jgi:O-antigen ligase